MNRRIYLLIVAAVSFLTSCSEEFLEEKPKDAIYADNLYENYDGFRLGVNALFSFVYSERQDATASSELGIIWKIGVDNGFANTELSWTRGLNQYNELFLNSEMLLVNGGAKDGLFMHLYRCVNSANLLIRRAENPSVDWQGGNLDEDEENKNLILAHAHLIRAWAYRHLAYTFGDVPLSVDEITGSTYRNDWERNSVQEIQEQIEEDLLFAEEHLPEYSEDVIVLSKVVAQHYLTDLYLWTGENELAEEKGLAVAENPNYSLITERYGVKSNEPGTPFMDQFYDGNVLRSQGNTEALWVFPNIDLLNYPGAYHNSMRRTWVPPYYNSNIPIIPENGGRGIGRAGITPWAFSIYEEEDERYSEYAVRKYYVQTNGDTIHTDYTESEWTINHNTWRSTRKWDWTFSEPSLYTNSYSYGDQPYLRLADTYLLLAEAQMKLGKNADAAEWINKIRRRANASEIDPGDVTLDFILDERSRELVTEENRRETLVRTGKLVERTRLYNAMAEGSFFSSTGIQNYHELLPIPLIVIEANTGREMDQNPGYY